MGIKVYLKNLDNMSDKEQDYQLKMALRKFKKICNREGVVKDFRRHEFFEKPSDIRRREKLRKLSNIKKAQKQDEDRG